MRGWETGTLEIEDVKLDIDSTQQSEYTPEATRLRVVTSEKMEVFPKSDATLNGTTINWSFKDTLRLPVYSRYQSSVIFEIGKGSRPKALIGKAEPDAIAVLWMQDLMDDIEQEVKLPVLVGKNLKTLRQNVINDQTAKYHDFKVVGWLTTRLKLDSGLDEDHEVCLCGILKSEGERANCVHCRNSL